MKVPFVALLAVVLVAGVPLGVAAVTGTDGTAFGAPQPVIIAGYHGDAMEPFISRDGRYLFFNDSNAPGNNTDLFVATHIDAHTFAFRGRLAGIDSPALEAVPSMDLFGNFYFISNRSYDTTLSTVYRGRFSNGAVPGAALVAGLAERTRGLVIFDAEISPDGATLYFAEGVFSGGPPESAGIVIAHGSPGGAFARDPSSALLMEQVNAGSYSYAPSVSASGREIFFTKRDASGVGIYRATRATVTAAFGVPQKLPAIAGFSEAPSLSMDGKTLYYHHREDDGTFRIYCVTRAERGP